MTAEKEMDEKTGLPVLRQHTSPEEKFKDVETISGQRLMSFKNIRRTGTITIRQIHNRKTTSGAIANDHQIDVSFAYDAKTGTLYGMPLGIFKDDSGNVLGFKWKTLRLKNRAYNLENYADAEEWHILKNFPQILGGTIVSPGMEAFEVIDTDARANNNIRRARLRRQAEDFIESLEGNALKDFARLFKTIDVYNNTEAEIRSELMDLAGTFNVDKVNNTETNPVLQKIEDESGTAIQIILRRCVANGIVEESLDKGFTYRNIPLGISEINAVEYLRANKNLLAEIDADSKRREKERKYKVSNSETPVKSEVSEDETISVEEEDKIRKEAQALGIKGYHVTGIKKLKAKVAELKGE